MAVYFSSVYILSCLFIRAETVTSAAADDDGRVSALLSLTSFCFILLVIVIIVQFGILGIPLSPVVDFWTTYLLNQIIAHKNVQYVHRGGSTLV